MGEWRRRAATQGRSHASSETEVKSLQALPVGPSSIACSSRTFGSPTACEAEVSVEKCFGVWRRLQRGEGHAMRWRDSQRRHGESCIDVGVTSRSHRCRGMWENSTSTYC